MMRIFTLIVSSLVCMATASNGQAPVVTGGQSFAINENSAVATVVGTAVASNSPTSWAITANTTNNAFAISAAGQITVINSVDLDREATSSLSITVTATNGSGTSPGVVVTINLNDVNDVSPVVTAAQSFNINENLTNASVVGTVLATDGDVTATTFSAWTLTNNPGGAFAINASSGQLTVATSSYLDREARANVVVTVTVSDGTNTSATQDVTINLNDVNDVSPVVTAAQSFNINENLTDGSVVGTVLATDGDVTATTFSAWTLTNNPGGAFAINASSGQLTVATSSYLDREARANVVVTVTVSDGTNTSATQDVTINLNDVNDVSPVVTAAQSFNINENLTNGSVVGTVLATDGDVAVTTFSDWTLTSNPGGAFAINASSGQLTVATSSYLDFETNPVIVIQVTVSDGTNISAAQNVTINLNDLDETPPIADAPDAFQTPQRLKSGVTSTSQVRSNEAGNIYLVRNGTAVISQSEIDAAITAKNAFLGRAAAVASTGYTITIPAVSLINEGDYNIVAVDAAGNVSAPSAGADSWLTIDNTPPSVAITLVSASPSTATSLDFTITFSESVTGVDISDFVLATGTANDATGTISNLSGSGAVYTVTVNTIVGQNSSGTNSILNLNLIASPAIADLAANGFAGTVTLDNEYLVDNTKPALSDGEFTLNPNGAGAETITFTMNETLGLADLAAVTGFTVSTGTASPAAVYSLGSNTITLTNAAGDGTWTAGTTVTYTPGNVVDIIGNTMNPVVATAVTIQTVSLVPGDIAFTGYNSDPTATGGDAIDGFSFVLLKDIPINTTIKFTDNGWSGDGTPALTTDESTISWNSTSAMQAGTEITITETTDNNLTTTHGTIASITGQTNFSLSDNGDQVLAYQGANNNPTFIAGIHSSNEGTEDATLWNVITDVDGDNNRSALPPGLTNGVNAISFSAVTANENRQYKTTGVTLTGSAQQLRASMMTVANWNAQNDVAYTLTSGVNKFPIRPVVTAVSIPAPFNYIISPAVRTATLTVHDDRGSTHTGLTGNIAGFSLSSLTRINATTYTAQFVVTEGGTDVAAGSNIPLTISLTSAQGNTITSAATPNTPVAYTTPIAQVGDPIDANSPYVVSINRNTVATTTTAYSGNTGTSATSVVFRVTFSEDMNSGTLTASDFSIPTTLLGGVPSISLISAVTGTSVFDVTVTGYTGTGTIGLNYVDTEGGGAGGSVTDLLGNPTKSAALAADGSLTGQTFSIVLPTPTNEAFTLSASNITGNSVTISWNSSATTPLPSDFLVMVKPSASGSFPSTVNDGVPVSDAIPFVHNVVRIAGTNSLIITPLNSGTSYDFIVYKYALSPNNTSNNIDFETTAPAILNNVVTNTASVSSIQLNSSAVPISSLLNGVLPADKASVLQFKIFDDGQDPLVPNVMSLQLNGVSEETVTFTLREELTLPEGASVTGFTSSTGIVANAVYTGKGNTNTITLRNAANGTWTATTTISYSGTGNAEFITLGKMQAINAHPVEAGLDVVQIFTTNGNFIVPAGVTSIQVEVWGAGGAGGTGGGTLLGGGGGGGGGYSRSLLSVTPLASYSMTVGSGANPSTLDGGQGELSSFGGIVTARGGNGGLAGDIGGTGGTGGQAALGLGDIRFSGGNGGNGGLINPSPGGGGGSSSGSSSNGNGGTSFPCSFCGSPGGVAPVGGASGGSGSQGGNGFSGFVPGGGGGGTNAYDGSTIFSGGGGIGRIRVTYSSPTLSGTSDWAGDNSPFKFSKLVITQGDANNAALANWQDVIAGAELFDGTTTFPATSVNPTNITFDVIPSTTTGDLGFIPDAVGAPSSKTYTLKVWLRDDINNTLAGSIDGLNLDFKVDPSIAANLVYDDVTNSNQKSSRLVGTQPAIESGANTIEVVATQLDFTTSPNPAQLVLTNVTSTSISPDFLTRPNIRARDANGNTDLNYTASLTLSNSGVIPVNPNPVAMVNGIGTFPVAFQYQDAGDGTLTATSSTAAANSLIPAPAMSTPVTVSYSNLSRLQPGVLITPVTFSSLNTAGFVQVFDFRVVTTMALVVTVHQLGSRK
jgi:hypothetical protein